MPMGSSLNSPEKPTFWSSPVLLPLESLPLVQLLPRIQPLSLPSLLPPPPAGSLLQAFKQPQGEKPTCRISIVSGCQVPGNNSSCGEPAAFSGEVANAALRGREGEASFGADLQVGSSSGHPAPPQAGISTSAEAHVVHVGPSWPGAPHPSHSPTRFRSLLSKQEGRWGNRGSDQAHALPQIKYRATCGAGGQSSCLSQPTSGQGMVGCTEFTNKSSQGHKWHQQTLWVTMLALKVEGSEVGGRKLAGPPSYS